MTTPPAAETMVEPIVELQHPVWRSHDLVMVDRRDYDHLRALLAEARRETAEAVKDRDDAVASRLIEAWVDANGRPIPWAKAVQIAAIVIKQPDAERDRLLRIDDEDGSCEMCGRSDTAQSEAARAADNPFLASLPLTADAVAAQCEAARVREETIEECAKVCISVAERLKTEAAAFDARREVDAREVRITQSNLAYDLGRNIRALLATVSKGEERKCQRCGERFIAEADGCRDPDCPAIGILEDERRALFKGLSSKGEEGKA